MDFDLSTRLIHQGGVDPRKRTVLPMHVCGGEMDYPVSCLSQRRLQLRHAGAQGFTFRNYTLEIGFRQFK